MVRGLIKKYNKYHTDKLPNITPHSFRHTYCTNMANRGMNPNTLQYLITKAIETGAAPETLVKRMVELEKEKKTLEGELKRQEKGVVYLDKEQVIFWLEQFKDGNIEDEDFRRQLIDLFVNSVTVWDEPDDYFKITIAYNLTSLQDKTYRLPKGGTLSDFASNTPVTPRASRRSAPLSAAKRKPTVPPTRPSPKTVCGSVCLVVPPTHWISYPLTGLEIAGSCR